MSCSSCSRACSPGFELVGDEHGEPLAAHALRRVGVARVDQLMALADDGAVGEVEDAAVLVVAPPPEDQHRLRLSDLQLLLLRFVRKPM